MDLTFKTESGIFNYRVCAVIKHNSKLLAMKNNLSPYYYLPGGRVNLHESAENAIIRELKEELGIKGNVVRPLWLAQQFFVEDVSKEKFHELCIYYLVDVSDTYLINKNCFAGLETNQNEFFEWLDICSLNEQYLYPLFIKEKINDIPENLEILTEYEYRDNWGLSPVVPNR
ncbi:MAG: NUDIX domain-containing protein [Eubacterium sp.]|nr:NUDIX domain-containing protein [Eubacterium sp.]